MELKKNNFSDMTTEDLIKKKKSTTFATGLLAGALIGSLMIMIFFARNNEFTPLLVVPFVTLPILVIIYGQVRIINKELKNRKSN